MDGEIIDLKSLSRIFDASYGEFQRILDDVSANNFEDFIISQGQVKNTQDIEMNRLVQGDNILFMKELLFSNPKEKIDLIYVDPPFFSRVDYEARVKLCSDNTRKSPSIKLDAYQDCWSDGLEVYLKMLVTRCLLMRELLSDTGGFWIHLDWHVVHYVKVLLDQVFGRENFVNEIIWQYKSGGSSSRRFSRKHDTLLFYSKGPDYYFKPQKEKSYNRGYKPYRFKGVTEYKDEKGWYTLVNQKDVWPIDMVGRTSKERTGYATQKPEALISMIIESCTKPGDLCVDFFGGSGTLAKVAYKAGRRFYSCDIGKVAMAHSVSRMALAGSNFLLQHEKEINNSNSKTAPRFCPEVKFDLQVLSAESSNKNLLKIRLEDYAADVTKLCLKEEGQLTLKKFIQEDSIGMVEYWSVDAHYDGESHRSTKLMARENGVVRADFEELGDSFQRISIVGADILGNTFIKEYNLS